MVWDIRVAERAGFQIDTPPKRSRLPARKNPYWHGISGGRGGVSLGYRRSAQGAGSWIAKIVLAGRRIEERIGPADDDGAGLGALTYRAAVSAALEWGREQTATIDERTGEGAVTGPTVRSAVEAYIVDREKRSAATGKITSGRLRKHVLSDPSFAATPLSKLRASHIEAWRGRLPLREREATSDHAEASAEALLAPATLNRLLNDLRAALNATATRHRRELSAHVTGEISAGTKAVHVEGDARRQLLSDQEVRRVVEAAFKVDDTGDFGRLVMLAAATGARFSQLRRLRVADLQSSHSRLMIAGSRKGRAPRAKPPVAVPLAPDHIDALEPALFGRGPDEPLLVRWAYRRAKAPARWERDFRRPWGPAYEIDDFWTATIAEAGVPADTVMYALRHSSIIRGLRNGLPIRLVAALHDTSVQMIERHYSAYIIDATEDLARRATLSFSAVQVAAPAEK